MLLLLSLRCIAQKEAIVMGEIENPSSSNIFVEYRKNLFTLDKQIYEATVDLNNLFGFKVNINEPRTVVLQYQGNKMRLFVVPGDTLIVTFNGDNPSQSVKFKGKNAAANLFLKQADNRFPDWADEKNIDYIKYAGQTVTFQKFIDTAYTSKTVFLESYNTNEKVGFTKSFSDYILADLTYWRAFHVLNFYNRNNLVMKNQDIELFFKNTEINQPKALNNEYYIRFLSLYLENWAKNNPSSVNILPQAAEVEKQSIIQMVVPRSDKLQVWENPLASRNVVTVLSINDEAYSQNLTTNDAITFSVNGTLIYDYFLKIKTIDGRLGWVPQSYVQTSQRLVYQRQTYNRNCFDENDALCGFDKVLNDKPLYFAALRDLILSTGTISKESMIQKTESFITQNRTFREYNDILRGVLKMVETDRENLMSRLIVPDDCQVSYFNLNQLFFDKNQSAQFNENTVRNEPMVLSADPMKPLLQHEALDSTMTYKPGKTFIFKGLAINDNVPPFNLIDIEGKAYRQQDLLGRVVYIDFWATWCSPCQAQLTHSQGLVERYKDNDDIIFLFISVDTEKEEWLKSLKDNPMKGIQIHEPNLIPRNFAIEGLPNYFIIDKNGRVAFNSRISTKVDAESMITYLLGAK